MKIQKVITLASNGKCLPEDTDKDNGVDKENFARSLVEIISCDK